MTSTTIYTVAKIKKECGHLLENYWAEADERRESCQLSLDYDSYAQLERAGMLKVFVHKDDEKVVGFVVYIISPCAHTRILKATTEITYVVPGYRGTGVVDDMYATAERYFKATGVTHVFMTLKTEFGHKSLIERAGFKHVENVYFKEL